MDVLISRTGGGGGGDSCEQATPPTVAPGQVHLWATRKNTSNSSDYFETAEAMRKTFELDWEYARAAHGLEGFIKKVQAEVLDARERETLTGSLSAAEERAAADAAAADRDAILEAEVVEAREVVWSNHLIVYAAFDYYAVTYGSAMDASAEYDIQSLSFNGFLAFARDAKFCSKFCPVRLLEIIFTAVNVDDERVQERLSRVSQKRDELNQKHRLNRHEFVEALVRTAIVRYVQSNEFNDVSEAVDKCCRDMRRYLPRECTQSSDVFRSRFCYCELTDAALRKHEATLVRSHAQELNSRAPRWLALCKVNPQLVPIRPGRPNCSHRAADPCLSNPDRRSATCMRDTRTSTNRRPTRLRIASCSHAASGWPHTTHGAHTRTQGVRASPYQWYRYSLAGGTQGAGAVRYRPSLAPAVRVQATLGTAGAQCFTVQHGWRTRGVEYKGVQSKNDPI